MLQVHDELCFSVIDVEEARQYAEIMEQAVLLEIPNRCDIKIGPNWGEAS